MSDSTLPNGMRLGDHVKVYSAQGKQGGLVLAAGEVIAYAPFPTVVVQGTDGSREHVHVGFDWEALEPEAHDWTGAWSEDLELFYEYLSANGWAQHFHCGWEGRDDWRKPRAVDDGAGMCGKEWAERDGVVELVARAQGLPEVRR